MEEKDISFYINKIRHAVIAIDKGSRPSINVKTLDGTLYELNNGTLHREGPDPVWIAAKGKSLTRTYFVTLTELYNLVESSSEEAEHMYNQLK